MRRWPVPVVLATLATGAVTALGLAGLASMALRRELGPDVWTGTLLLVWLPHAVCFPALLLRLAWARAVAACLAFGWIAVLIYQYLTTTAPRPWEVALAAALVAGLLALGVALLWGPRAVRSL